MRKKVTMKKNKGEDKWAPRWIDLITLISVTDPSKMFFLIEVQQPKDKREKYWIVQFQQLSNFYPNLPATSDTESRQNIPILRLCGGRVHIEPTLEDPHNKIRIKTDGPT